MASLEMLIDLRTCSGCHAYSVVCKVEFDLLIGVFRDTVKYVETGTYPQARRFFIPVLCNHGYRQLHSQISYDDGSLVGTLKTRVQLAEGVHPQVIAMSHNTANDAPLVVVQEFLIQHLLPWAPAWLARVESVAQHQLYRTAARLSAALLSAERATAEAEGHGS